MEKIVEEIETEREYLDFLEDFILAEHATRKEFCQKCGITESSLHYLLTGKKKLPNVERKVLDFLNVEKEVVTKIIMTITID